MNTPIINNFNQSSVLLMEHIFSIQSIFNHWEYISLNGTICLKYGSKTRSMIDFVIVFDTHDYIIHLKTSTLTWHTQLCQCGLVCVYMYVYNKKSNDMARILIYMFINIFT
jgi:hypothetical protein